MVMGTNSEGTPLAVLVSAIVVGIGFVVGGPAMNALIPALVPRQDLGSAVALNAAPITLARSVGPALGAFAAATVGSEVAFAFAALGNGVFALVLIWLKIAPRPPQLPGADRSILEGFRHVGRDRHLLIMLLGVMAISIGADPAVTLTPALAHRFGHGAELVGVFGSSFGVGAAGGLLVLAALRRRTTLGQLAVSGLLSMSLAAVILAWVPMVQVAVGAFALAGTGMMLSLTGFTTQIQERIPDAVRGRVMALWSVAWLGSRPLSAAVDGALADLFSLPLAFTAAALATALAAYACRQRRALLAP
jgi:predicted MFS family arabinose efflux permease